MGCCRQCQGLENLFDKKTAANELKHYRKKGPSKTTRLLLRAISAAGLSKASLLDIGGGVGAIQHELMQAVVERATHVDASSAYLDASKMEAQRRGHADKVDYYHGDFVTLALDISAADIVTLDRVICCYPDMPALVRLSSERATKLYGLVYPRESWWVKVGMLGINAGFWLLRKPLRFFVHSNQAIDAVVTANGLKRQAHFKTLLWQVLVYSR